MAISATATALLSVTGVTMLLFILMFVFCLIRHQCNAQQSPGTEIKVPGLKQSDVDKNTKKNLKENESKVHRWTSMSDRWELPLKVPLNVLHNYMNKKPSEAVTSEETNHVPRSPSPLEQSMLGERWDGDEEVLENDKIAIVQKVAIQPSIRYPVNADEGTPLGLTPRLYRHISDPDGGDYPRVMGKLGFCLKYSRLEEKLSVTVIGAKNLVPSRGDQKEAAGTYVSAVPLPKGGRRFRTKVQRNTFNPQFSEETSFPVPLDEVRDVTLKLNVVRLDVFSKPTVIGQVTYPLRDQFLGNLTGGEIWQDLFPCGKAASEEEHSEILVSLKYDSIRQQLNVELVQARNANPALFLHLPPCCASITQADVLLYGRVSLMRGNKVLKSQRTVTQRGSFDPVFKENFSFDVSLWGVNQVGLIISVCQRMDMHSEMLGMVTLGSHVGRNIAEILRDPKGLPHWYPLD